MRDNMGEIALNRTIEYKRHLENDHIVDESRVVSLETRDNEFNHIHVEISIAGFAHVEKEHNRVGVVKHVGEFEVVRDVSTHGRVWHLVFSV